MKKIKMLICIVALTISCLAPIPVVAETANEINAYTETIEPRTDIKDWVYKVENGNLYKRLYNFSTGRWESDWIFVCSGVEEG